MAQRYVNGYDPNNPLVYYKPYFDFVKSMKLGCKGISIIKLDENMCEIKQILTFEHTS